MVAEKQQTNTTDHRFHFISGLPRSGSTLLAAILRQNPNFHAGISSPLHGLYTALLAAMAGNLENAVALDTQDRRRILQGLLNSFYADCDRPVIFDTNRMWCARLWSLVEFFPQAKVICMVRNVSWIMDSFERAFRKHPMELSKLYGDDTERATVYGRVEALGQRNRPVGVAWAALKEAYYGDQSDHLLLVDYDLLARKPKKTMDLIYDFIGQEPFAHDFDAVEFDAADFDQAIGAPGLHKVQGPVKFRERQTILPPDLFEKFADMSFWEDQKGTRASIIAPKKKDG